MIVPGFVSACERDSKYQLCTREIRRDGNGDLFERYQKLRDELEGMGVFALEYKQSIPKYAKAVGIVTASIGAAIRDIMNISAKRSPYVQLVPYPALIQGEQARYSTVQGIKTLDRVGLDVVIVSRSGGSIESLWAFNEEMVVRATFGCYTPVTSAAGHETDVTIADYVADMGAPAPSAVVGLAVLDYRQSEGQVTMYHQTLLRNTERKMERCRYWLEQYRLKLRMYHPERQLRGRHQRLVELEDRMKTTMEQSTMQEHHRLTILNGRLHGLSPLQKVGKGFGFVTDGDGRRAESVETPHTGDMMEARLVGGKVKSQVVEIEALAVTTDNVEESDKVDDRK